jgi:hypothetical protein
MSHFVEKCYDNKIFEKSINTAILQLNKWFNSNLLLLNFEKKIIFSSS